VLSSGGEISPALLRSLLPEQSAEAASVDLDLDRALGEVERKLILRALMETNGNKAAAAVRLGIGERTLWTKLKKHSL